MQAERAELWEDRLWALAHAAKIDLAKLPAQKSHPDKVRLAATMKQTTSASNAWLANLLAMGQPAANKFLSRLSRA